MGLTDDLVAELVPMVRRIVGSRFAAHADLDDLSQDVLVKVLTRLDGYRGHAPLAHWVSRVAVNVCRDERRRLGRSRQVAGLAASPGVEADAADPAPDAAAALASRESVERLLARLAPVDRQLVVLIDLHDHSAEEVRRLTGLSVSNIRVRVHRARRKLRESLLEQDPAGCPRRSPAVLNHG